MAQLELLDDTIFRAIIKKNKFIKKLSRIKSFWNTVIKILINVVITLQWLQLFDKVKLVLNVIVVLTKKDDLNPFI